MGKGKLRQVCFLFLGVAVVIGPAWGVVDVKYKITPIEKGLVFEILESSSPQHVAMDHASGNLFVAFDAGEQGGKVGEADFVLELNTNLEPIKKWGNLGIAGIRDIALDEAGWIYVTDASGWHVKKINRDTNQVIDFISDLKASPLAVGWNKKNNNIYVGAGENLIVYDNAGKLISTKGYAEQIRDIAFFPGSSSGIHCLLFSKEVLKIDTDGAEQAAPFSKALKYRSLQGFGLGTDYKGGVWMGEYNCFGRFATYGGYGSPKIFKYETTFETSLFTDKKLGHIGDVLGTKDGQPNSLYITTNNAIYKVKLF